MGHRIAIRTITIVLWHGARQKNLLQHGTQIKPYLHQHQSRSPFRQADQGHVCLQASEGPVLLEPSGLVLQVLYAGKAGKLRSAVPHELTAWMVVQGKRSLYTAVRISNGCQ